jgi:hypothetical protein
VLCNTRENQDQDKDQDKTRPKQDQDTTKTRPKQDQDKTKTRPRHEKKIQGKDNSIPTLDKARARAKAKTRQDKIIPRNKKTTNPKVPSFPYLREQSIQSPENFLNGWGSLTPLLS